jgi:hypothetical protein
MTANVVFPAASQEQEDFEYATAEELVERMLGVTPLDSAVRIIGRAHNLLVRQLRLASDNDNSFMDPRDIA